MLRQINTSDFTISDFTPIKSGEKAALIACFTAQNTQLPQATPPLNLEFNKNLSKNDVLIKIRTLGLVDGYTGAPPTEGKLVDLAERLFGALQFYRLWKIKGEVKKALKKLVAGDPLRLGTDERLNLIIRLSTLANQDAVDDYFKRPLNTLKNELADIGYPNNDPEAKKRTDALAEALHAHYKTELARKIHERLLAPNTNLEVILAAAEKAQEAVYVDGDFENTEGLANIKAKYQHIHLDVVDIAKFIPLIKRTRLVHAIKESLALCTPKELQEIHIAATHASDLREPGKGINDFEKVINTALKNIYADHPGAQLDLENIELLIPHIRRVQEDQLVNSIRNALSKIKLNSTQLNQIRQATTDNAHNDFSKPSFEEILNDNGMSSVIDAHPDVLLPQETIESLIPLINEKQQNLLAGDILAHLQDCTPEELQNILFAANRPDFENAVRANGMDLIMRNYAEVALPTRMIEALVSPIVIIKAINTMAIPNDLHFAALSAVIDARDHKAIRQALGRPEFRALFGGIDFAGRDNDETILTNQAADIIVQAAETKRAQLLEGLDVEEQNERKIQFALAAIKDHENPGLNEIADIKEKDDDQYFEQVRAVIFVRTFGDIDLGEHLDNEDVLTKDAVKRLHQFAIKTRSQLRREHIEDIISKKTPAHAEQLTKLVTANTIDDIRHVLNDNEHLGGLEITHSNHLTKKDALAIRRAAIDRKNTLTGHPARERIAIPKEVDEPEKYDELMKHIKRNLHDAYTSRIVRLEERRKRLRHSEGTKHEDWNTFYETCLSMRDQLNAYKTHLETHRDWFSDRVTEHEKIQHKNSVVQNIQKLDALLHKIDKKYNKPLKSVAYFADEAHIIPKNQVEAALGIYKQAGPALPRLVGGKLMDTLKKEEEGDLDADHAQINRTEIRGKDNKPVQMLSVIKKEKGTLVSEFHIDPTKLDMRRRRGAHIPNDEIMKWAIAAVASFQARNKNPDKTINILGNNLPEECAKAIALYCEYRGIQEHPYKNLTSHDLNLTPKNIDGKYEELRIRFRENGPYLTGGKPELAIGYKGKAALAEATDEIPRQISSPRPRGPVHE